MANAIKSKDLAHHQARVAGAKKKAKGKGQSKTVAATFSGKTFSQLVGNEKDDLLKAIALELGLIEPDA